MTPHSTSLSNGAQPTTQKACRGDPVTVRPSQQAMASTVICTVIFHFLTSAPFNLLPPVPVDSIDDITGRQSRESAVWCRACKYMC